MSKAATLKKIAGVIVDNVDELSESFVTLDEKVDRFAFKYGDIKCELVRYPRSAPAVQPPWIKCKLVTTIEDVAYAEAVQIWVLNPSKDSTTDNRKALKKALEKYRDSPNAVMGQFDLGSEKLVRVSSISLYSI